MAGLLADINVAGRLALRTLGRRLRSEIEPPPDLQHFTRTLDTVLTQAPADIIREYRWVELPADQPPWLHTGITLSSGEEVSYFVEGRAYANRGLDIYLKPALQLWCKVGEQGEVFRGTRASHSFRVRQEGELLLGNYFPNDWADPQGSRKQSDEVYKQVSGELKVLIIRWTHSAAQGLRALQNAGGALGPISDELARLDAGDITPQGWQYLWHLGPAEIYRAGRDTSGQPCICCRTHADVGILQKDVDLPLLKSTEISWRWLVEKLPSRLREDTVPSHDYMSLAVEFDNGRDITYYWSSTLPVGAGYDCPLPNWAGKEYHVVVRSGQQGLGEWRDERRNLYADYRQYMGEPPARIVRVWLIANSIFQRQEGACDYAGITLSSEEGTLEVL